MGARVDGKPGKVAPRATTPGLLPARFAQGSVCASPCTRSAAMRMLPLLLLAALAACAQRREPPPLPGETVAPDIALLRGTFVAGAQPDGNSVLLRAPRGLVVFDSGRHPVHARRILDAARATRLPVAAIVNSHWHLDHVAGNVLLREAWPRAEVYASDAIEGAMRGFLADYRTQLEDALAQAPAGGADAGGWRGEIARIDAGARLFPTRPVTATGERTLAGRKVTLGLERNAVSGGDVWLYDPATRTLLAGDLVTLPVPLLDTACAEGWREALARLDALPFAILVPGHGAPMTHAQFAAWRGAYEDLLACAAGGAADADCKAGWLRDAGPLVPEADRALAAGLLDYYLPQALRAPAARRARYCDAEPGR